MYLAVAELLPTRRELALAAGLLVAFLPQFGFISGAVNNDAGINVAGALTLYLTARALRRGLTWRLGIALGVALALMPVFKQTGYALYPAVAIALAGGLWRDRGRIAPLPGLAALAGSFAIGRAAALLGTDAFDFVAQPAPGGPQGAAPGAGDVITNLDVSTYLSYLWQVFLPPLPFMTDLHTKTVPAFDIYVERGFASFGWYAMQFPLPVYVAIAALLLAVAALGLRGLWSARAALRRRWPEVALVALAGAGVIAAVEAAFWSGAKRDVLPEQGRYAFSALVAFAAMAAWGVARVGPQRRTWIVGLAVTGMVGFNWASQALALESFFT